MKNNLYLKILRWAYKKGRFTRKDIQEAFDLDNQELEHQMHFFMPAKLSDRLIDHSNNSATPNTLTLTNTKTAKNKFFMLLI